ncbi:GIY-YIG nuclease family protein [Patescibacteria group bacterium]
MNSQDIKKYKLPDKSGVYLFFKGKELLYIGKATSIRTRVRSYFAGDLMEKRGPVVFEMVEKANNVKWQETDSVLEALILEVSLIKKYQPKYNSKEKSDKSHNYIVITDEDFPRVLIKRGRELEKNTEGIKEIFGPFPQGGILRDVLKIVRKIFPFRDKCVPLVAPSSQFGTRGTKLVKPCFNRQIRLCPGVCTGEISKREYRKIITNIKMLLNGKKPGLIKKLEKEMRAYAKKKEFEKAGELKRQVFALNHIQDVVLLKENYSNRTKTNGFRIEGYDVAHLSGKGMLGVMTVLDGSEPNKNEYRKFNIKTVDGVNDVASLKEVLERRFAHPEWQYPRLIVVDGGKAQKNAAEKVMKEIGVKIPVLAVVKDEKHRPKEILGKKELVQKYAKCPVGEKEILLVNYEAHRFSITGHRKKMRKALK